MSLNRSVLFIDDEAYRTRSYRDCLTRAGWDVTFCSTIDEADGCFDTQRPPDPFAVAVVDLQMGRPQSLDDDEQWDRYLHLPGLWYIAKKSRLCELQNTAIAVLTNKNPSDFRELLVSEVLTLRPGLRLGVYRKTVVAANSFSSELQTLLAANPGVLIEPRLA